MARLRRLRAAIRSYAGAAGGKRYLCSVSTQLGALASNSRMPTNEIVGVQVNNIESMTEPQDALAPESRSTPLGNSC
jgi:hypothetical protein